MMERDFVGYSRDIPRVEWPDGARLAISLVVNYEEGSEPSVLDGDTSPEASGNLPPGTRNLQNESFFEYGSRAGAWRLMDILDQYRVPVTFFACAVALERNPQIGPEIVRRGHEVCGHGYRWESYHAMSREEERTAIRKAVASIARTSGQRPLGWYIRGSPSLNTRELLAEEGGFVYDSNAYNDDLPYYVKAKGKKWLVVPYSLDVNDFKISQGTMITASQFHELMRSAFDRLYYEGATHPKMMSIGLHCRLAGKPSFAPALQQFLEYAKGLPKVWFARRIDIARWWLQKYP